MSVLQVLALDAAGAAKIREAQVKAKRTKKPEWRDNPPEQWIYIELTAHHRAPYTLIVGDFARARFREEVDARRACKKMIALFRSF